MDLETGMLIFVVKLTGTESFTIVFPKLPTTQS